MKNLFEDYFSELQADMVSICLEYVEENAENIYIYCSCEDGVITSEVFYKINGILVRKHKLNDAIITGQKEYDVSIGRQKEMINIINDNIKALRRLCQKHQKDMPTQMKLTYDVEKNSLNVNYRYDFVFSNDPIKTAQDILQEWYDIEQEHNET